MSPQTRTLLVYMGTLGILGAAVLAFINTPPASSEISAEVTQTASASTPEHEEVVPAPLSPEPIPEPADVQPASPQSLVIPPQAESSTERVTYTATRITDPYPFPLESFPVVNERARAALVNILCSARRDGSLKPVSGSGVIIDPRGVILTNAHVAQYVLLAQSKKVDLSCVIRQGAPARPLWQAEVLHIPRVWVEEHASDITNTRPTGTGEHDYALLRITGPATPGGSIASPFPSLPVDTRNGIGFVDDAVLAASYPAEFIGGLSTRFDLYPTSSITQIQELLTFEASSVDLFSLGGIIGAQSGSSGGAVVNAWGRLIGIITTTSEGATTAERDLRALTISYISNDLAKEAGADLATILAGDIAARAAEFHAQEVPSLTQLFLDQIPGSSN